MFKKSKRKDFHGAILSEILNQKFVTTAGFIGNQSSYEALLFRKGTDISAAPGIATTTWGTYT
jgi:hypothetical protein